MKRILSLLLSCVLATSLMGVTALAADKDKKDKISNVRIYSPTYTVRVDRTIQLEERVYPRDVDYDHVEWYSSDFDIAEVDEYGEVTGIRPGTVTITVRIFDENDKRLSSGSIEITVTGRKIGDYSSDNLDNDCGQNSGGKPVASKPAGKPSTVSPVNKGGEIAVEDVVTAVAKSTVKNKIRSITFKGFTSVSASTLRSAAAEMKKKGGVVLLNFDTLSAEKSGAVEGRLTIDPRNAAGAKGDIQLGVFTNSKATGEVSAKFKRIFKNRVVVVKALQKGRYGMNVIIDVKIGKDLAESKQLELYSFNPENNKYFRIKNADIRVDANGYAHFITPVGDYLVISEGVLARR